MSESTRHHPALIKVSTARLRSGPGKDQKATALLDEGRSAIVVGKKDGWVKIRLDSGREGWLRHDLVDVAKARVHDDSDESESTSARRHRRTDSDEEDSDQRRSKAHHKSLHHEEIAAATHSKTYRASTPAVHHTAHVAQIQVSSAPHRITHVTALQVATASTSEGGTTRTTELKFDNDGDTSNTDVDATHPTSDDSDVTAAAKVENTLGTSTRGDRLVRSALAYRGTPYRMGATGNGAFDCSGFTMYLFGKEGSSLPRTAAEQYDKGEAITKDHLQPGDLVFFRNTYKSGISHVGIYIGNNSFVHASGYGRGVRVDSLNADFYVNHWAGARRPR